MDINIIKETNDYLIINKPAGLIVHGAKHIKEKTLVDYLLEKYPDLKDVGEDLSRPGIVHRLDKDVSGLLLVAKNSKAFSCFKEQFQKRTIVKKYTALVYGKVENDSGQIDFSIQRASSGHRMAACPKNSDNGRKALTYFKILKRFINYTLLEVEIKTGRTHQIRVHMFAFNHPLVGDNLYSTKKTKRLNIKLALPRIFLVSSFLSFKNLEGELVSEEIGIPEDLQIFLKEKIR